MIAYTCESVCVKLSARVAGSCIASAAREGGASTQISAGQLLREPPAGAVTSASKSFFKAIPTWTVAQCGSLAGGRQ